MSHTANLRAIELSAQEHRLNVDHLHAMLERLNEDLARTKRDHLPAIRAAVAGTKGSRHRLALLIEEHRNLFAKPKTREAHGLRIGYRKDQDQWHWPTMPALVHKVREVLGPAKAKALIQVEESVPKKGLTKEVRKQLGIPLTAGEDRLIIEQLDGEVDKLVNALLGDLSAELEPREQQEP